ncbi:MAG: hypothetical protein K2X93_07805 [Candidatus Obscuribacterales bacterium]|nr:hypothetical protein [Candidatus Obscuribacterales bacterium]
MLESTREGVVFTRQEERTLIKRAAASTYCSSVLVLAFCVSLASITPVTAAESWESPAQKADPITKLTPDQPGSAKSMDVSTAGQASDIKNATEKKELDNAVKCILSQPDITRMRKDRKAAKRIANYHWLDKAAESNPLVIEAITNHKSAAKILARHPRLAEVSEWDHYTCRRITKWKGAARVLASNAQVREVAGFDPEGLYRAIAKDRKIIRILSKNPMFDQMIVDNPDLGRVIAKYM